MIKNRKRFATRVLTAAALGTALTLSTTSAFAAGSCKSGKCGGGPNNLEVAIKTIESSESTIENSELEVSYQKIEELYAKVKELNVESNSKVRNGLKELAKGLSDRADAMFESAVEEYEKENFAQAITVYERLAKLEGLPAAKKSTVELDKEPSRVQWRELRVKASAQIQSADHLAARDTFSEMNSLARTTGYTKQTRELATELAKSLLPRVAEAEKQIEREQFGAAYTTLIEISRLTDCRESAVAARRVLGKTASLDGMRQAKAEYDAKSELIKVKDWIAEITHPSTKEWKTYTTTLDKIAKSYAGTAAGEEAQRLLAEQEKSNAQQAANF